MRTQTNMKPLVLFRDKNEMFFLTLKNSQHAQESMTENIVAK